MILFKPQTRRYRGEGIHLMFYFVTLVSVVAKVLIYVACFLSIEFFYSYFKKKQPI